MRAFVRSAGSVLQVWKGRRLGGSLSVLILDPPLSTLGVLQSANKEAECFFGGLRRFSTTSEEIEDIIEKASPSVVRVWSVSDGAYCVGSGFMFGRKIFTAAHNIGRTDVFGVVFPCPQPKQVTVRVYRVVKKLDLFVMEVVGDVIDCPDMEVDTRPLRPGAKVMGLGYPHKDHFPGVTFSEGNFCDYRIIHLASLYNPELLMHSTCFTIHGHSGGPLIDKGGKVVGMMLGGWNDSEWYNFSMSIEQVISATYEDSSIESTRKYFDEIVEEKWKRRWFVGFPYIHEVVYQWLLVEASHVAFSAFSYHHMRCHPDKNADDPIAADVFKEVTFSYDILSNPGKQRQYDASGFEAIETDSQELELDLSSLGPVNTMFAALFSKLGVAIKTTVSATVLEEALNGTVPICPFQLGQLVSRKVEKQSAHFYSVEITEREAQVGIICRVHSTERSKFKLLYFEQEENGGLSLALQEDSARSGKVTSAGMFFLHFPVYRFDQSKSIAIAKDPDAAFFKKLEGFQLCEVTELKAGKHIFAVYGDNFFKSASYTLEIICAEPFSEENGKLQDVEARILTKKVEVSKFETEYREVLAQFTEMTNRYTQEMQAVDDLLKEWNSIRASYTTIPPLK